MDPITKQLHVLHVAPCRLCVQQQPPGTPSSALAVWLFFVAERASAASCCAEH